MSLHRYNPARDANEPEIVAALEAAGYHVTRLSGAGVPDLLVSKAGRMGLMEVKRPTGPKGGTKGRTLTPTQERWHTAWTGPPVPIVTTAEEALIAAF